MRRVFMNWLLAFFEREEYLVTKVGNIDKYLKKCKVN